MTQKQTEFVGFLVPETLDHCLRLQAILQGKSKGAIIRDIVEQFAEGNNWSVDDLILRHSEYLFSKWYTRYRDVKSFKDYLKEAEDIMLKTHKLPEELVKPILKKCKEHHAKT